MWKRIKESFYIMHHAVTVEVVMVMLYIAMGLLTVSLVILGLKRNKTNYIRLLEEHLQ
jgi:hypothetical protein